MANEDMNELASQVYGGEHDIEDVTDGQRRREQLVRSREARDRKVRERFAGERMRLEKLRAHADALSITRPQAERQELIGHRNAMRLALHSDPKNDVLKAQLDDIEAELSNANKAEATQSDRRGVAFQLVSACEKWLRAQEQEFRRELEAKA